MHTHKATRTDVPDMEILSKKGKRLFQVRLQTQSRGVRYPAGLTTRNAGFRHCKQREVLTTSYTKSVPARKMPF